MNISKELERQCLELQDPCHKPARHALDSPARKGMGTSRKRKAKKPTTNGRNVIFDLLCQKHGIPLPDSEYEFASPRKWRFDFCWADYDLYLEVQGGIFTNGRHVQGAALLNEYEKINEACIRGWRPLFCTPDQIKDGSIFPIIKRAIEGEE